MRTTWVVIEKTDHLSKTGSKVKARLCTMGNSSEEYSKDSIQFESPICGRDTVKEILSMVPDNRWYDRFHRYCLSLSFTPAPGDSAAYNYDRDGARGSLAIHVDNALMAGNALFYDLVIVPLFSQFSISKIEKKEFKFLGMRLKQTAYFTVSLSQDTKSIKDPLGV